MAITLKDLAKLANVSRPVVSAVVNNKTYCRASPAKRAEILRLAAELNYHPNVAAKSLRGKPTGSVAILLPEMTHMQLFCEISRNLKENGYRSMYVALSTGEEISEVVMELDARGVDGVIGTIALDQSPLPTVNIAHDVIPDGVTIDLEHGGYMAGKHLLSHGHRKIGIVASKIASKMNRLKIKGFKKAFHDSEEEYDDSWNVEIVHNPSACAEILELINEKGLTAFFCSNDYIAGKLLSFLEYRHYKIPEEVAVIGFDGFSFSEFTISPLTTIIQPYRKLAKLAVASLLRKMCDKDAVHEKPIMIKPELHIGSSCGCEKHNRNMLYWEGTLETLEALYDYSEPLPEK